MARLPHFHVLQTNLIAKLYTFLTTPETTRLPTPPNSLSMFTEAQKRSLKAGADEVLSEVTTPSTPGSHPEINGVIAGATDASETVYLNALGTRNIATGAPISVDNTLAFFSCTKALTCMGMLILYDRGLVDLDVPASRYLPRLGAIGVIEPGQVDVDTGTFIEPPRKPKTDVTVRHLMLHTAGFSYAFVNLDYSALAFLRNPHIGALNPTWEFFTNDKTPLVHEPGSAWMYGHSSDWLGLVIQEISGQRLSRFLKENLFDVVGMDSFTFRMEDTSNMVSMHRRTDDNLLKVMRNIGVPLTPEIDMGGQGCFGTVGDYLKFIRVWLNFGYSPDTKKRVLSEKTARYAIKNHLPEGLSVDYEKLFGVKLPPGFGNDGWTLGGFAYGMNEFPTGRPKGAVNWLGLANLFYWIDFENQVGGFYGSQFFPVMDTPSLMASLRFEGQVYEAMEEATSAKL